MTSNTTTISVKIALEYAFAVHRILGGYLKNDGNPSNRDTLNFAIKNHINKEIKDITFKHWIPLDFEMPEVIDEDRQHTENIDQHFKKYMFKSIAGSLNDFEKSAYSAVSKEEIELSELGMIAYVPELVKRDQNRWNIEKIIKQNYKNSKIDSRPYISGNMTIIEVKDITNRATGDKFRIVVAGMDENLYGFSSQKIALGSEGKIFNISGKFKHIAKEFYTDLPLTKINYVKVNNAQTC